MKNPELILIAGKPYSGKSTIAAEFARKEEPSSVKHLSMGDHVRAILAGDIESGYAEQLKAGIEDLKRHIPMPPETTLGIFTEFMNAQTETDLIVVDGHPTPSDITALHELGAIAVCKVEISDDTVYARSAERTQRFTDAPEDRAAVQRRLEYFAQNTLPVLEQMALEFPFHELDGEKPMEENAAALSGIYHTNSLQI